MTDEQFHNYVGEGIAALPEWVKDKIQNVAFLVADEPTRAQRIAHELADDETLFGLYEGVPLAERGNASVEMPDMITIFKNPILDAYTRDADIRSCIMNTVWHEVAHYFGYGEEWVEGEEQRRGKVL
jgi:predicted Zn-dependent protease with MMP-like domain